MFRSLLKVAQIAARTTYAVNRQKYIPAVVNFPVLRKYSSGTDVVENLTPEEKHDAAWVYYFLDEEMDLYGFIVGFRQLLQEDMIPEPKIIQAALYALRRLDNFPMSMRALEMVKTRCEEREDIYNYLMQELQPTLEDLGLPTVEQMGLDKVVD